MDCDFVITVRSRSELQFLQVSCSKIAIAVLILLFREHYDHDLTLNELLVSVHWSSVQNPFLPSTKLQNKIKDNPQTLYKSSSLKRSEKTQYEPLTWEHCTL